jgi:hypothetical protein
MGGGNRSVQRQFDPPSGDPRITLAVEFKGIRVRRYEHGARLMDNMLRTFANHLL